MEYFVLPSDGFIPLYIIWYSIVLIVKCWEYFGFFGPSPSYKSLKSGWDVCFLPFCDIRFDSYLSLVLARKMQWYRLIYLVNSLITLFKVCMCVFLVQTWFLKSVLCAYLIIWLLSYWFILFFFTVYICYFIYKLLCLGLIVSYILVRRMLG